MRTPVSGQPDRPYFEHADAWHAHRERHGHGQPPELPLTADDLFLTGHPRPYVRRGRVRSSPRDATGVSDRGLLDRT